MDAIENVKEDSLVQEGALIVSERGVEDTSFAVGTNPGNREILVRSLLALRILGRLIGQVERHQHPQLGAIVSGRGLLIDFIAELEVLALERLVQRVGRLIQFERPGSATAPGVSPKVPADHLLCGDRLIKVVCTRMNHGDAFAGAHKINQCVFNKTEFRGLCFQSGGIVQDKRIILREVFRLQCGVVACAVDFKSFCLLCGNFKGLVAVF